MPTADDIKQSSKTSFLFKGPFGFGKTLAAASFAIEGPIFLAYFDKKEPVELAYFFRHILKRPELLKNIEYECYSSQNAHQYLNKLVEFSKYCDKFAVITDSLTTLTASAVNWSLGYRNPAGAKKDPLNAAAIMTIPDFDEYKTETSYVTQALDICRALPAHIIWTAHPLPKMDMTTVTDVSGRDRMKVVKTNSLVTYGSKVAGMVPGQFTEIYHFSQETKWNGREGKSIKHYIVNTSSSGDEYAKTALNIPSEMDITNAAFYDVWKAALKEVNEVK